MRKAISAVVSLLLLLATVHTNRANQSSQDYAVQVSALAQTSPSQLTLSWPQDSFLVPKAYTIFRKSPGATWWGEGISLPGTSTNYVDSNVQAGSAYEYQIVKTTSQCTGYGYIYAGINVPLTDNRGKLLLVVDNTYAAQLTKELARLQQDLVGDGWTVCRLDVARTDSVVEVKNRIKGQYNADPANVKAVFLFGHVPVAYSGNIVPDGHAPDHQGAWPCDGFYGDMDGDWTDNVIRGVTATDPRNRNVPGDGKFDQSAFPAPLKLMVGRVDLAKMPGRLTNGGAPTFASELELLRNYLEKDHNFRTRQFDLPRRGIVGDHFGIRDGEAFAASGFRNLASFFDPSHITTVNTEGAWIPTLRTNSYLWAYGCGPGSFTSIGGLGNSDSYHDGVTTELVGNDIKAAFTMLYGSWLGDWDSEDNFQRAILALPSHGLACVNSGRPHWFLQHMALGEPIGFSTRLTQNNRRDGLYKNQMNNCAGQIHIALMGDPTLRMHIVAPPSFLNADHRGQALTLSWSPPCDSVVGYHVYRADNPNGPFSRLTRSPILERSFTDTAADSVPNSTYMVRSVKLETSGSGTYFNASQGVFITPGARLLDAVAAASQTPANVSGLPKPTGRNNKPIEIEPDPPTRNSSATNTVRTLTPTGATAR